MVVHDIVFHCSRLMRLGRFSSSAFLLSCLLVNGMLGVNNVIDSIRNDSMVCVY